MMAGRDKAERARLQVECGYGGKEKGLFFHQLLKFDKDVRCLARPKESYLKRVHFKFCCIFGMNWSSFFLNSGIKLYVYCVSHGVPA